MRKAARLLLQLPQNCRVFCAINPAAQWGWPETLANKTNYLLEILAWQNSFNPKKKQEHAAKKPKIFDPFSMVDKEKQKQQNKDNEVHTVDDIKTILSLPRH